MSQGRNQRPDTFSLTARTIARASVMTSHPKMKQLCRQVEKRNTFGKLQTEKGRRSFIQARARLITFFQAFGFEMTRENDHWMFDGLMEFRVHLLFHGAKYVVTVSKEGNTFQGIII